MAEEIETFLDNLENQEKQDWNIFTFFTGSINNQKVVLVKSGVGKVFASMVCQYLIDKFNPQAKSCLRGLEVF